MNDVLSLSIQLRNIDFTLIECIIFGRIINEDHMKVRIFLIEKCLHYLLVSIIFDVVVAGHHNTEWDLFLNLT